MQKEEEEVERRKRVEERMLRYRGRRHTGQVFLVPNAAGRDGFTDSATAQAELNCGSDFRFSTSYLGRVAVGDDVMFSARRLPAGCWEAFDLADMYG